MMMDEKAIQLRSMIEAWEKGDEDVVFLIEEIRRLTGKEVDEFDLHSFQAL